MASGLDINSPSSRLSTSTSRSPFHLPSSSFSSSADHDPANPASDAAAAADDDDGDETLYPDGPLPFPTALSRGDFLGQDFNAASYLSSLFPSGSPGTDGAVHRHQTLEDLRAELRERSSAISAELLELVNANYAAFLGLGDGLRGGGERAEDVRVALLGFRRQVEEVQARVRGRKEDVQRCGVELRAVRGEVEAGRRMLELDERCEVLLARLEGGAADEAEVDDNGDAEDEGVRLADMVREYNSIISLANALGRDLPYLRKMEEKIMRCRNTLLVDLGASLKEARKAGNKERTVRLLGVYRLLGAYSEGVKMLKEK